MSIVEKYLDRIKECERDMSFDDSPCIYRGEPECYPRVSSSLYRHYEEMDKRKDKYECSDKRWEKLEEHEREEILEVNDGLAKRILARRFPDIQHLGGKTNWIDFTSDRCVALHFACGDMEDHGRIIVAKESVFGRDRLKKPCGPYINCSQKSVLVRPGNGGVIEIKNTQGVEVVEIPLWEKMDILRELGNRGVSDHSLYSLSDEIFGYLRLQSRFLAPVVYEEMGWKGGKEGLEKVATEDNRGVAWIVRRLPTPDTSIWFMPEDEETRDREYFEGTGWHKVACDEPFLTDNLPNIHPPPDDAHIHKLIRDLVPPITGIMIISKNQHASTHDNLCRAHKEKQLVLVKQSWQWRYGPSKDEILQGYITNISSRRVTFQFNARCVIRRLMYD